MSTIIDTEIAIMNEVKNEVMNTVETTVVATTKKSFPSKHIKYLSYALYIMKQVYPDHDTCVEKFVEHLHLSESIEFVMNEIDASITPELENEVREIKRNLNKKPKRKRAPPKKGSVPVEENITEQIVSLASEPIIQRGPPLLEEKEQTEEAPIVPAKKTAAKKTRAKKDPWEHDPERPSPAFVPIPAHNLAEEVADVEAEAEAEEEAKEEVKKPVKKPKVVKTKEVVKEEQTEEPKKTKVSKTKVKKDEVVAEVATAPEPEKKVAKAKTPRVAKAKAPATVEEVAPFTEELVEEPEQ